MGTQIGFTPLLGALADGPLAYGLDVDGLKLVLDCGWSECVRRRRGGAAGAGTRTALLSALQTCWRGPHVCLACALPERTPLDRQNGLSRPPFSARLPRRPSGGQTWCC